MKRIITLAICALTVLTMHAQEFEKYFTDKTLRADYMLSGDHATQQVALKELGCFEGWAGRRHHLSQLPLTGNGQVTMRDKATGQVIYRMSFSSLFQEWIGEEEAKHMQKSFEHTVLLPYPKEPAVIEISLLTPRHKPAAVLSHTVDPSDILIRPLKRIPAPMKQIMHSGDAKDKIDIVIMAEGYTADEAELFYKDAQKAASSIFSHAPFNKYKDRFNVTALACPSQESGVSVPRRNEWKDTAVKSNFDTFYSARYLTTGSIWRIHDWLTGIPCEHIIILANTDVYGGGGIYNSMTLTTAHHKDFWPVVTHEFGHSFGGLADEYAYSDEPCPLYPYDIEPWEKNITTLADFSQKWEKMLPRGTKIPTPVETTEPAIYEKVGVYEGAGYTRHGIYRPATECRMKINEAPGFCPVCRAWLEELIKFYTQK